jgi:hypothetical protein
MHHQQTQQPTGGIFFQETSDFKGEILKMTNVANGIAKTGLPAQITIAQANKMISTTTRAVDEFRQKAYVVINDWGSAFVRDDMKRLVDHVQWNWGRSIRDRLGGRVAAAVAAGKKTVASGRYQEGFTNNIANMLHGIAGGYEMLEEMEDAKPWFIKMLPSYMVGLMAAVGNAVASAAIFVSEVLRTTLDEIGKGTRLLINVLKWGSVAGGLYLLYGALKPEGK